MDPAHASVRIGGYRVFHIGLWVILHDGANHGAGNGSELVEGKDIEAMRDVWVYIIIQSKFRLSRFCHMRMKVSP